MHIAIFGCGQLAQMTAQAGIKLGLTFAFVADEGEDCRCVDGLGEIVVYSNHMSAETLFDQLQKPDVITVEKEMVDATLLTSLKQFSTVYPCSNAIKIAQNRIREKTYLRSLDIPTADFEIVTSVDQLNDLIDSFGLPIYIKAAESGYDGYNQWRIKDKEDVYQTALVAAIDQGVSLIAEKHVAYKREVSVIAARNGNGDTAFYPLMDNRHEDGVLIATIAPAPHAESGLQQQAFDYMKRLLVEMDYVGVLTMECFETENGIVANELAPRVHNSGHWTIEGNATSQFENHCRSIASMELGSTEMDGVAGIVNMLGKHGDPQQFNGDNMYYHAYGKEERPRRKLGHVTVCSDKTEALRESLNQVMTRLYSDSYPPL
ncbi:MAG: 5-(carboxyamino)imidazole ribonucleotide synthase [Cellvibrionaceae bacterium]